MEKHSELKFRGVTYLTLLRANDAKLQITIEEKDTGRRWKGEYSSAYIEDITQKTGNFKKFPLFLKMLSSALDASTEAVCADILTFQDLELLRSKRQTSEVSRGNNKRYLIITYMVEFDRVHYPLPLSFEETPDPAVLQASIERLKKEIEVMRRVQGTVTAEALLKENSALKDQIQSLETAQRDAGIERRGAVEVDTLIRETRALEEVVISLRTDKSKQVKVLQKYNEELEEELGRMRGELDSLLLRLERGEDVVEHDDSEVSKLKEKVEELKGEERELRKELGSTQEEADEVLQVDKKLKLRIKQLEAEITSVKRRGRYSSPRPYSSPARSYTPPRSRESSATRGSFGSSGRTGSDRARVSPSSSTAKRPSPKGGSPSNSLQARKVSPAARRQSPGSRERSPAYRKNSPIINRPYLKRSGPNSRGSSPGSTTYDQNGRRHLTYSSDSESESRGRSRKGTPKRAPELDSITAKLERLKQLVKSQRV
jgi:coiled-coil domain-containing protein 61